MNIGQLFKPYKQRLLWEGLIKAWIVSLITSAVSVFIISFMYHIFLMKTPVILTTIIGLGAFLLSFLLSFFIFFYPTRKKVAVRIDESGLKERAETMLAYHNINTEIAELQRRDTVNSISALSAKEVKWSFNRSHIIICAICICLSALMIALPYDVFAFGSDEIISDAANEEKIKALIAELREQVKASELDDELKESLGEIVDALEEELKDAESDLEMAARIEDAKEEMQKLLEKAITKNKIGEALQKYELTQELGEAISAGDGEKVTTALDILQASLTEYTSLVSELGHTVNDALTDSGEESTDELYSALFAFSESLAAIDLSADDFDTKLGTVFDTAEKAILAALEKQAAIESEMNALEESMSDAKDDMLGREKEETTEGEMPESGEAQPEGEMQGGEIPEGGMPEGEMPEGEMPDGEMPEGGMPSGDGSTSSMTEGIYDPISGSVSYGEVFAAYYADYLAALEAGEVSDELQEIIDKYFSSLN